MSTRLEPALAFAGCFLQLNPFLVVCFSGLLLFIIADIFVGCYERKLFHCQTGRCTQMSEDINHYNRQQNHFGTKSFSLGPIILNVLVGTNNFECLGDSN